jgi:hypothetical protein
VLIRVAVTGRTPTLSLLTLALWLAIHASAAGQTLDAEDPCPADVARRLHIVDRDASEVACAAIGDVPLAIRVELVDGDQTSDGLDDVRVHLIMRGHESTFLLNELRRRWRRDELSLHDVQFRVRVQALEGVPEVAYVSVQTVFGEDVTSANETIVLVRLGAGTPVVRWAGDGYADFSEAYGSGCYSYRLVTVSAADGVAHVRTHRLWHRVIEVDGEGNPIGDHASVSCPALPRVRYDVPLAQ